MSKGILDSWRDVPSDGARQSNPNTYTLLGWQLVSIRVNSIDIDIQTLICASACLLQRWMEMTPTEGLGNIAEVNQGHCCYELISLILHCISVHMNLLPPGVWPFTLCMGTQPCTSGFLLQKVLQDFCSVSLRCTVNHTARISSSAKPLLKPKCWRETPARKANSDPHIKGFAVHKQHYHRYSTF